MAAGAAGTAALAGCPGTVSRTFSAQPVVLPDSAQAERNYTESTVDAITTERSGSVAGIDFEATITSHLAAYRPTDPPDEPADGELYPDIGAVASPAAAIQGSSINPLATAPLQSIVAGDVLPRVRIQMLSRLSGLEGRDLAWLTGPTPIDEGTIFPDRQEDTSLTGRFLDDDVEIATFGGVARDAESRYAVLILVARRVVDDVAIAAGVLDTPLSEQSTDRPIVDADNGHFTPEHLSGGLSAFLDLLPRFQVEGSDETDTPTITPILSSTPSTATSPASSGSGMVIDDFEDGDTKEYSTTGVVNSSLVASPTKNGSTALEFTNMYASGPVHGLESGSGLPNYPHLGDRFRVWFRFGSTPNPDQLFQLEFGQDDDGNEHVVEATKLGRRPDSRNEWWVTVFGNGSPQANNLKVQLSKGTWYAFDVSWKPHEIRLELVDATGTSLGSATIPGEGDSGDDHLKLKADVGRQDKVICDHIHIRDHAR